MRVERVFRISRCPRLCEEEVNCGKGKEANNTREQGKRHVGSFGTRGKLGRVALLVERVWALVLALSSSHG